jgi:hypothetical protein
MRRISILGMMAVIGYVAFAFAALTRPTAILVACFFTLTIAAATLALLGAIFASGRRRCFWAGFVIVCWGYLVLVHAPWFRDDVGPCLIADALAPSLYDRLVPATVPTGMVWVNRQGAYQRGKLVPGQNNGGRTYVVEFDEPKDQRVLVAAANVRPLDFEGFKRTCNHVFATLIGIAGGFTASWFAGKTEDSRREETS